MKRFRRKDLRRDRFVEEVSQQVEYVSRHRKLFVAAGVTILVALVGGAGFWTYSQNVATSSNAALLDAIELYHGVVTTEDLPGLKTYATEGERIDTVTRALDTIMLDYSGTGAAAGAAFYSGLLDRKEGNRAEAESHFEQSIRGSGSEYPAMARLALSAMLMEDGDHEAAREILQVVVDNPTRTVSKDRASIELARTFIKSDPEQARTMLLAIQSENGPASPLAAAVLETLPEGS